MSVVPFIKMQRVFAEADVSARDAWIYARVENDCEGCESLIDERWRPAENCPVHGLGAEQYFVDLNAELDKLWPGRWVRA